MELITESKLIALGFGKYKDGYQIKIDGGGYFDLSLDFRYISDDGYTYPNKLVYMEEVIELIRLLTGQTL